ncbi:Transcriptional activator DEMETER [Linum perenne]
MERGGTSDGAPFQQNQAVIYTDRQGNRLQPAADWTASAGFVHVAATDMDRWKDVPFQCLMALAETANVTPWGGTSFNYGCHDPIPPHYGFMLPQESMSESSFSQIGLGSMAESSFSQIGLGFTPVTPQKPMGGAAVQAQQINGSLELGPLIIDGAAVQAQQINGSMELAPIIIDEEVRVEDGHDLLCQETLKQADVLVNLDENGGRNMDSASAAALTWDNHNREKVDFRVIDLNKTPPRRKPKRKKHVPKVLRDGKPKKRKPPQKTPKQLKKNKEKQGAVTEALSSTPVNGGTTPFEMHDAIAFKEDTPSNIRKYSRRGVHKTVSTIDLTEGVQEANDARIREQVVSAGNLACGESNVLDGLLHNRLTMLPPEATGESADPQGPQPAKRPCRRGLDFDLEEPIDQNHGHSCLPPNHVARSQTRCGIEVKVQNTSSGSPYDFNSSVNEMLRCYSSKARIQVSGTPIEANAKGHNNKGTETPQSAALFSPSISVASSCISSRTLTKVGEASGSVHRHSAESATGFYNGLSLYQTLPWAQMPVCRKKRSGKGQNSTVSGIPVLAASEKVISSAATPVSPAAEKVISSTATASINHLTYAHYPENGIPGSAREGRSSLQYKLHNFSPLYEAEMSTKRRSRAPVRVRDLASLVNIPLLTNKTPPTWDNRHSQNLNRLDMRMEALVADGKAALDALVTGGKTTSKPPKRSKKDSQTIYSSSKVNDKRQQGIMVPFDLNQFPPPCSGSLENLFNQMLCVDGLAEQLKHLNINRESPSIACAQRNELVPYHAAKQKQKQNAMVIYTGDDRVVPFQPPKKKRPRAKVEIDEETLRVFNLLLKDIDSEGIDGTDEAKKKYWEDERRIFRGRTDSFIARMHLVQGDRRFTRWKGSVVDSVVGVFLTQNVSDHLSSSAFMSMAAHFPIKREQKPCWEEGLHCVVANPIVSMPDEETLNLDDMSNQSVADRSSITLHEPHLEEAEIVHTIDSIRSMSSNTDFLPGEENYNEAVISSQNSTVSSQNSNSPVSQTVDRKESPSETDSQELDTSDAIQVNSLNGGSSFVKLLQLAQSGSSMPCEIPNILHQSLNETDKTSTVGSQTQKESVEDLKLTGKALKQFAGNELQEKEQLANCPEEMFDIVESSSKLEKENAPEKTAASNLINHSSSKVKGVKDIDAARRKAKSRRVGDEIKDSDWEALRRSAKQSGRKKERAENAKDSVDWERVRCADVNEIAETIKARGMNNMLAARIKEFLNKLVAYHGSVDLEWLRDIPPDRAKEYLLSFNGLGLKSVECVRLLTLHHLAFPVDTNVGRIAVRLGWVPLEPLPESLQLHLLEMYPILDTIQKYLWPRLCKLDQKTLYELHYQLITFGKVFCTKSKPNCNACPMRGECRHFASAFASARLSLPGPEEKRIVTATQERPTFAKPVMPDAQRCLPPPIIREQPNQPMLSLLPSSSSLPEQEKQQSTSNQCVPEQGKQQSTSSSSLTEQEKQQSVASSLAPQQENHQSVMLHPPAVKLRESHEPIIEEPLSPEPECTELTIPDIEDFNAFYEDPDEIPTIKLNVEELAQNIETYIKQNLDLRESDISLDLVAMATEATYIPPPKLKNISRLRTEHQVYELPDCHPLLKQLDKREYDDPSPYLLAIWTPGETADTVSPTERRCTSQSEGRLCDGGTCPSCSSYVEAKRQIVRGTILIPCRTAMRGSFPLNGTYFQVNEVFADQESSLKPIEVPTSWIWNLPRRTVYFGTSVPTIFRGLTTEEIQHCFWRGFVCVRGFDRETRAPRPLMARLHFPTSKLKPKGKNNADDS